MSISQRAEELKKRMERAGLARVATTLQALLEPSIRLNAGGPSSQPTSRLGGLPNMPADFQWPTRRDGQPHSFLAQIDLAQLEAFDVLPLPSRGSLFFFCDAVDIPWGRDPGEKDGSAILYSASALNDNAPHTPPRELDGGYIFKGFSLEPVWDLTGPGIETWEIESLRLDNSESYAYSQLFAEDGTVHRIGGYPNVMQNDNLQLTAELVSHGIYCDAAGDRKSVV